MTINQTEHPTPSKSLRLWPGIVAAVLMCVVRFVLPIVAPDAVVFGMEIVPVAMMGFVLGALAIFVWWIFFSRAPWAERLGAIVLMVVAVFATSRILHESVAGGGMGMLFYFWVIPVLSVALVMWAVASRRLSNGLRRASLVGTILLACGIFALVRTGGTSSNVLGADLHWRWTPTPEQRLLTSAAHEPLAAARDTAATLAPVAPPGPPAPGPTPATTGAERTEALPAAKADEKPAALADAATAKTEPAAVPATGRPAEWPGFRGPERDAVVRGVRISTDWAASSPVELWRRPIGPGWSSFAVLGDHLYTQEQRGDDEVVACYKVSTGRPVWRHGDRVRFWESNAGPGPRATPTLSNGRVYTFGATGILNALDARDGSRVWSRNVASDTGREIPIWGFASSPLVVDDIVIVAAAGTLAAYDVASGQPRWVGPRHGGSYSSPHRATIDGVGQILLLGGPGAISVAPADGAVLWKHEWAPGSIVQPAFTDDGDILVNAVSTTGATGMRRLNVKQGSGGWNVEERWTSIGLKPYFNDFVVHKGHATGFDGSILACIDLADGKRKWKGGRYGNGQLILLADQDVLLVVSEEGELALVAATTDQFKELARFKAIEGKTWNHPALVGDVLLVRNDQEMAAFRLPLAGR